MPRSSGTYTLPAGNPVVTGTTITSTWANTTFSDVATALTNSVPTDGSAPMVGALQMGNNKITGVTDGTASSDVATVNQISNPTITGGTIDGAPIGAANPKNGAFLALTANSAAFSGTSTAPTVTPSTDSSTKIATTAFVQSAITAVSSGVTSFNTRSGAVTLSSGDVTTALGYTPYNASGATVVTTSNISSYAPTVSGSGAYGTWGISISGNAATATTATNATGLSGTPNITVNGIQASYLGLGGATGSTNYPLEVQAVGGNPGGTFYAGTTTYGVGLVCVADLTHTTGLCVFQSGTPGSPTGAGSIYLTSATSVNYATTSDRRLKTNISTLTNSGSFIDSLLPRTFNWVTDGASDFGFIADELQQIAPKCVSGTPNEIKPDGTPVYQNVDVSTPEMMANIIAELQTLRKRVAELESK